MIKQMTREGAGRPETEAKSLASTGFRIDPPGARADVRGARRRRWVARGGAGSRSTKLSFLRTPFSEPTRLFVESLRVAAGTWQPEPVRVVGELQLSPRHRRESVRHVPRARRETDIVAASRAKV